MFIDLLRARRSVRRFDDTPVEQEKLDVLIEAILRSPSAVNRSPWEFVVVTDREILKRLSEAKEVGSSFLRDAPLAIVVCADPERSDVWIEDASIAAIICHLAAADLGLGSCWIQVRLRRSGRESSSQDHVAAALHLKAGLAVQAIIAIGYAAEAPDGHPKEALQYDKVSFNQWGTG